MAIVGCNLTVTTQEVSQEHDLARGGGARVILTLDKLGCLSLTVIIISGTNFFFRRLGGDFN